MSAAGLRTGDVIVAVDGAAIGETQELRDAMNAHRAGDEVEISFYRGRLQYRQKIRVAGAGDGLPAVPPVGVPREVTDRQRIEALERRVQELESRLADLEKRLEKPAPPKE